MYEFAVTPAITQLRRPGVTISEIAPGSLAAEIGLETGDRIVRVNGRAVRDYLDFRFQTSGENELIFFVRKTNGETWEIDLDREEGEAFGMMFEQIVPRQCANECLFCFCKGNPEDARPSLFVRDEDIRLSFLYGNYTTLSSVTPDEMDRIIEQRLSPQYVSVHATDLKTRAYLLGVDEQKADVFDKLRRLLDNGIEIHAQIVLCPGINDGVQLEKTLRDLAADHPGIVSAAIVPVALTRYNLDDRLIRVTPEFCRRTITEVEKLQDEFRASIGTTFAFLGDEIYLKGGAAIPAAEHYGDYPQIEDGVGMIRSFTIEFERFLEELPDSCVQPTNEPCSNGNARVRTHALAVKPNYKQSSKVRNGKSNAGTILTGELFAPVLEKQIAKLNRLTDSKYSVLAVPNTYFGGDVGVAGLLSGQDLVAVKDKIVGDFVIIPDSVIKSDEPVLIDGMHFDELKAKLDMPVYALDLDGLKALIVQGLEPVLNRK